MRLSAPRLAISAVAIGAAAATTGVVLTAPGSAKPTSVVNRAAAAPAPAAESPAVKSVSQSDAAIRAYWTAARMKAAKPAPEPASVPGGLPSANAAAAPNGPEVNSAPGAPQAAKVSAAGNVSAAGIRAKVWTRHGRPPASTTGKIFFTSGASNYVCSGSVVWTRNRSTIWTAGHCLYDGTDGWARNVVFKPDYVNGRSKGTWVARRLWVTGQWKNKGNPAFDAAAFVVKRQRYKGKLRGIAYFTGGQGITFNIRGLKHSVRSFGYPGQTNKGRPMNGNLLWWCSDTTFGFRFQGLPGINRGMRCTMGKGSSGGPWIRKMDRRGLGYIIGNVSHGVNRGQYVSSPYLGGSAYNVFKAARYF